MLNRMMNCRFGALPTVAVKTPRPEGLVSMSSQRTMRALPSTRAGRQPFAYWRFGPEKLTTPFELTCASV